MSTKMNEFMGKQAIETLLHSHKALTNKVGTDGSERYVLALLSDHITTRLDLDTHIDEVFSDLNFEGTYHDAILAAIEKKAS